MMPTLHCPWDLCLVVGWKSPFILLTARNPAGFKFPISLLCFFLVLSGSCVWLENRQGRAALTSFCVPENLCSSVQRSPRLLCAFPGSFKPHLSYLHSTAGLAWCHTSEVKWKKLLNKSNIGCALLPAVWGWAVPDCRSNLTLIPEEQ